MDPMFRMRTILLLEKISLNREYANKLMITDGSAYKGEKKYENIGKEQK